MHSRVSQIEKVYQEQKQDKDSYSQACPIFINQDQIKLKDQSSNESAKLDFKKSPVNGEESHFNHYTQYADDAQNDSIVDPNDKSHGGDTIKHFRLQNKFKDLIFQIKLKFLGQRMLSKTPSRMLKNMTLRQFKQIDDLAYSTIQRKLIKLNEYNKTKRNILKGKHRQDSLLFDRNQGYFSTCGYFFKDRIWNQILLTQLNQLDLKMPVLDPTSVYKIVWDIIGIVMIVMYIFQIPLFITFQSQKDFINQKDLIYTVPMFVFVDILFIINTGIYEKGKLIKKRIHLLKNNLYKAIIPNIIIMISYLIYIYLNTQELFIEEDYKKFQYKDVLLLILFLKVQSLRISLNKFEEISILSKKQKNLIALLNLIFKIVFIAHIISCIWVIIAKYEENKGYQRTWLKNDSFKDSNWDTLYINAYYFTTVTMITIGFGDLIPVTNLEKTISVLLMIFSCGIFAYSMNTIGSILQNFNEDEIKIQQNLSIINSYMHKKNVNKKTQSAIREYLEYYWKEESDRNQESEEKIINLLSDNLREILQVEAKNVIFRQSSIFRNNFSDTVRQKMIPLIKEHRATPDEIICTENIEDDCSVYFIEKGSVEIFIDISINLSTSCNLIFFKTYNITQINEQNWKENKILMQIFKKESKQIATIEKGQSFGELSFFSGKPRNMSIRSREFTTLLILKREDFIALVKNNPEDYERFCTIKDGLNLYNSYQLLNIICLSCGSVGHLIKDCPQIHFVPNELKVRQQFMFNPQQERIKKDRQIQLKFNSLSNNADIKEKANILLAHYEIEDCYSSCSLDFEDEFISSGIKGSFNQNKRVNYEFNEHSGENKTSVSPLPQNQYSYQLSVDRNSLRQTSLYQIDENRESIVMDDYLTKSPLYQNQRQTLFSKEAETNKILSNPVIKEENEYDEHHKDFEEEIRAKHINNITRGILLNKEYTRKGSTLTGKKSSRLSSNFDSNTHHTSSIYNKLASIKQSKYAEYQKLNKIIKQMIQLFAQELSVNISYNSGLAKSINNQEQPSPTPTNFSSALKRNKTLFQEMSSIRKINSSKQIMNNDSIAVDRDSRTQFSKILNTKQKSNINDDELFLDGFDTVKSYMFYYPLNNIENQLELMCLSREKKRQKMIRNHFDNMTEIKRSKTHRDITKKRISSNQSLFSQHLNTNSVKSQNEHMIGSPSQVFEEKERKKSKFFVVPNNGKDESVNNSVNNQNNMVKSNHTNYTSKRSQKEKMLSSKKASQQKLNNQQSCENLDDTFDKHNDSEIYPKKLEFEGANQDQSMNVFCQKQISLNFPDNFTLNQKIQQIDEEMRNDNQPSNAKNKKYSYQKSLQDSDNQLFKQTSQHIQEYNQQSTQSPNSANGNRIKLQIDTSKLSNVCNIRNELSKQEPNIENSKVSNYNFQYNLQNESQSNIITDSPNRFGNRINIFQNSQSIFQKKTKQAQQN